MRVELASFERWYANQVKYHKVTGEEPGLELKQQSYSARDIAEMLHICESVVYDEMNKAGVDFIIVDYWKRYPKEAFDKWYQEQERYRTDADREKVKDILDSTMRMPEMARLLGVPRSTVYGIINNSDILETITLDGRRRVTKESFYRWYEGQTRYRMTSDQNDLSPGDEENRSLEVHRRIVMDRDGHGRNIGTDEYLTVNEAAILAGVNSTTVIRWVKKEKIEAIKHGKTIRIPRQSFEEWLKVRM